MGFGGYLKADTETNVTIGPVVAVADGFTPVTTLDLSTADEAEIIKHNATTVTSIAALTMAAIANADGYYALTLTAAVLDTEGRITVLINDDDLCLPARTDFEVVNVNVYDSMFAAATTDYLQVDMLQVVGVAQSATDLKDFADTGYDPSTHKVAGVVLTDTCTTNTDLVTAAAVKTALEAAGTYLTLAKTATDKLQFEATTNYLKTVPQDLNDVDLADATTLTANSMASIMRQMGWRSTCKMVTNEETGAGTLYKVNGTTSAGTYTISSDATDTTRTAITWA